MIERLLSLAQEALTCVPDPYFRLVTRYAPGGIVRERVFCYELYHQMRSRMAAEDWLDLHGEIDKRGHPDFAEEDQLNPDFVFHLAGTHRENALVVEVKGSLDDLQGIHKDFLTLTRFLSYGYKAGLFILYNHSFAELAEAVLEETRALARSAAARSVYIFAIPQAEKSCDEYLLSDITD